MGGNSIEKKERKKLYYNAKCPVFYKFTTSTISVHFFEHVKETATVLTHPLIKCISQIFNDDVV